MTCGERIKQEREKRKLSQEDLAEQMEVSRQAVSKWESGQSRPTKEKLERLSALFELPPEAWAEEMPPPPERAALRRWKWICAVLAAALCLSLVSLWVLRPGAEQEAEPEKPYIDTSYMFPKTLPLAAEEVPEFGAWPLSAGESGAAAGGNQPETVFIDQFPGSSWLEILRADPVKENHTTFYSVYAQYTLSVTDQGAEMVLLGRLTDFNHYVGSGLDSADYFTNVLGHDGWKITLTEGAACVTSWYFSVGENGVPYVLLEASGSGAPVECDVDGDGEKEVVTSFGLPMGWTVYDTKPNGRCVAYILDQDSYGQTPIDFSAEEGFTVTDSIGTVMARYLLAENQLELQPQTDFSLADYADAAGTELTFTAGEADRVLYNGNVRITPPAAGVYCPSGAVQSHRADGGAGVLQSGRQRRGFLLRGPGGRAGVLPDGVGAGPMRRSGAARLHRRLAVRGGLVASGGPPCRPAGDRQRVAGAGAGTCLDVPAVGASSAR